MAAVARVARDVSEVQEILLPALTMGTWSLELIVRYTVAYQSAWHRGRGLDPDINIISCTYEDGVDRRNMPMLPGLQEAICLQIEADELELN